MRLKQAIGVLDSTIPPSNNKMVDIQHLPIAQAWEAVKQALKGEWVPVEERLPEKNELVLCYCESTAREGSTVLVGMQSNGFWFLQSDANRVAFPKLQYRVTHWYNLPLPPEEKT